MEVELPNIKDAASTDYWRLASKQYPFGKFPKVSVGITIPRAGSVSRSRDSPATAAFERNLSQGTDGRSRPPKCDNSSFQISQKAANHDGSAKGENEVGCDKVSVSQPDDNANEQTGTFSFGTRREQVSNHDKSETPEFVCSQGKRQLESANKSKPNSEVLRMKLWEILGGASQNKQALASLCPDDTETPDKPNSQTAKGPSSGNKHIFTSPLPDTIKTPDLLDHHFTKCKQSSDLIESDLGSPVVVQLRPVSCSLGLKKVPAVSKQQSGSAKKPFSTLRSSSRQKEDTVFTFNEKHTTKRVVKHGIGDSGSLRTLRRSTRKAKPVVQKIHYSGRFSDKTTQDEREGKLCTRNRPSEDKGEKATSISLSRTWKPAASCSRSPKRGRWLNLMANVAPHMMQFPESLFAKTQNNGLNKLSSPQKTSLGSKKNDSPSSPQSRENLNIPENSVRSPHARGAAENSFNSQPSRPANPSPELKRHPWDHGLSPEINGKFEQVTSPWAGGFRGTPDDFASPTLAANVNISQQAVKGLDGNLYTSKYSKSVDKSRSSFLVSDPESEPAGIVDKTNELPGSESPDSAEEKKDIKQPSLSSLSPTEDEGSKSQNPSFAKGYKSHKWLSDMDGPDKSSLKHLGRKTNPKNDRMSKKRLSSLTPFATFGTQETTISDKGQEQCPDNYLARAFDQLVVVLGRFQTKIKSETNKKSSEILAATGEIIRQHLEGVEVQMQADVDKLANAGKSKRKRLESSLEVQQEKLRILHEKFKEEVNKQFQDCSNSLEDFESYHAELKVAAEKQKSSHKKLLVNAEKTVGVQLNDAESKIAEVQKRARKRMNGLKFILKELIAETAD